MSDNNDVQNPTPIVEGQPPQIIEGQQPLQYANAQPLPILEGKRYYKVYQTPEIPKPDPTAAALVWFFILLIIIIVIVAIIAWIIRIAYPGTHNDVTMRDLCARSVRASHSAIVGRNLTVACNTTVNALLAQALSIPPTQSELLNIELDTKHSSVMMTNASTTAPTVTLPSGVDAPAGFLVILTNAGGAASFTVQPTGTDTLNGVTTPLTVSGKSGIFYSMGILPNVNTVNWIRLA